MGVTVWTSCGSNQNLLVRLDVLAVLVVPAVLASGYRAGDSTTDNKARHVYQLYSPSRARTRGAAQLLMDTILVTGGAGFIGCNFVRLALAETDARLLVLDKLTYAGSLESLADVLDDPRCEFVQGDIADRAAVRRLFAGKRPAAVVNFAAESHVDRSIDDASEFIRTNIVGAFELLEAARLHLAAAPAAERERFRFLHVSTDEVYGRLGPTVAFAASTAYAPNSPYAASKAGADHLVRAYHETYGLPALLTNCSNNYGPYQYPEKLIPLMILNALEGK